MRSTEPSKNRNSVSGTKLLPVAYLILAASAAACKPRLFNDSAATSAGQAGSALSAAAEAQAESLIPFWPIPATAADLSRLPSVSVLGFTAAG